MLTLNEACAAALELSKEMGCEPVFVLKQGVDIFLISTAPSCDSYPNAKVCAEIVARYTPSERPRTDMAITCRCGHPRIRHIDGLCREHGCSCTGFKELTAEDRGALLAMGRGQFTVIGERDADR